MKLVGIAVASFAAAEHLLLGKKKFDEYRDGPLLASF
jgi:hypothetical protein